MTDPKKRYLDLEEPLHSVVQMGRIAVDKVEQQAGSPAPYYDCPVASSVPSR